MSEPTPRSDSPEPGRESSARERLMLRAEEAWKIRRSDPARCDAMIAEIRSGADAGGDALLRSIADFLAVERMSIEQGFGRIVEESLALTKELDEEPLWQARAFGAAGVAANQLGDYEQAMEYQTRALLIRQQIDDQAGISFSLGNIGNVALRRSDFPTALEYFLRALDIQEKIGAKGAAAASLSNIAIVQNLLGDRSAALETHLRALAILEEIGDREGIARALNNIGVVHHGLDDYTAALEYYQRARAMREELDDPQGLATSIGNIGVIHFTLGDYRTAQEFYERELEIRRRIGDSVGEGHATTHIGNCLNALGDHDRALEYQQRALAIQTRNDNRIGQARILRSIAEILSERNELPDALEHCRRSLDIQQKIGDRDGAAETLVRIGSLLSKLDRPREAIESIEQGLRIAVELGVPGTIAAARLELVTAREMLGEYARALEELQEHHRIREEIETGELKAQLQRSESRRQLSEARKEAEIERLRNVELGEALRQLEVAHERLKWTQTQLVQSEKMASLGQLVAGIAHEINNPINYVRAGISPLRRDLKELEEIYRTALDALPPDERERFLLKLDEREQEMITAEVAQLLEGIEEGARRTAEIVAGLRSFSRLDEDERKPVDLHAGLDSTLVLLGPKLKERITVRKEYGDLPAVECHAGQINQVFMNLLANAIDAIDGTGEITITTAAGNASVSVAIADTGAGIAPEHLEKIFDPFFTTKAVGSGTGLGLAICHDIVGRHGGEIRVESTPGVGSTFTLVLPSPLSSAKGGASITSALPCHIPIPIR